MTIIRYYTARGEPKRLVVFKRGEAPHALGAEEQFDGDDSEQQTAACHLLASEIEDGVAVIYVPDRVLTKL